MKLELKHLAPYLPYKLECIYTNTFGETNKGFLTNINVLTGIYIDGCNDNDAKPILVPLKELEYYSNGIKHLGYRTDKNNYLNLISDIICKRAGYDLMEMCFEEHIDVFGLIEKGLAIDKNTLSK